MTTPDRKREIARRYRACAIDCPRYSETEIKSLSDYFSVFQSLLKTDTVFWFRGHSDLTYKLAPTALRYRTVAERDRALALTTDMKRFVWMRLARPPAADDKLGWMQVAQHHGLPTRLLDWTQNAAVALFFACWKKQDVDGLVAVINPIELNQAANTRISRVMDGERDRAAIEPYLRLTGRLSSRGKRTVALNPAWNNERIALQHGCFTLHGSRQFELARNQVRSLLYLPILHEHKASLLNELDRVGVGEMFIFPEPEHVCSYLRFKEKL